MRQIASYFFLSAKVRSLSLAKVLRLSDMGAETMFARVRTRVVIGSPVSRNRENMRRLDSCRTAA